MAQDKADNSMDGVWLVGGALFVLIIIVHFFGDSIKSAFLRLKGVEVSFLRLFYDGQTLQNYSWWTVHPQEISGLNAWLLGQYIGLFFAPIAVVYAWWIWRWLQKTGKVKEFKKSYDLQSLVASQENLWPWVAHINGRNLVDEPLDKGPFAMNKPTSAFLREYDLLHEDKQLNEGRAKRLFYSQLGPLWSGPEKLPPHRLAFLAIFLAMGAGDVKIGMQHLHALALSAKSGRQDYSFGMDLYKKYCNEDRAKVILGKHAYVLTLFCSMYMYSRTSQILPSSYFNWLKPLDRPLWYTLNNVGRRVGWQEVGGAFAHWHAEEVAEEPILQPYVDEAVNGLRDAMQFIKF